MLAMMRNAYAQLKTFGQGYWTGTNSATTGLHPVGEKGVEAIQTSDGFKLVGLNGSEIYNFKGGERVYNAYDTKKLISSQIVYDNKTGSADKYMKAIAQNTEATNSIIASLPVNNFSFDSNGFSHYLITKISKHTTTNKLR